MWHYLKYSLDSQPWCVVTRPIAGLAFAGVIAGAFGLICGLAYGAVHNSFDFAIVAGLRLAGAGMVAGFVAGLWSGLDRSNCPDDEWGRAEKPNRMLPLVKAHTEPAEFPPAPR
jgi:hypothetical protein